MVVCTGIFCPLCGRPYQSDALLCDCGLAVQGSLFPVDPTSPEATAFDDAFGFTPVDEELSRRFQLWGHVLAEHLQHPEREIEDIRQKYMVPK